MKDLSTFAQVFWALVAFVFGIPLLVMALAVVAGTYGAMAYIVIPGAIVAVWYSERVRRQKAKARR